MQRNAQTFEVEPVLKRIQKPYIYMYIKSYKTCSKASSVKMCIGNQLATQEIL